MVRLSIKTTTNSNHEEFTEDMDLAIKTAEDILECGYIHFYKEGGKKCFKAYTPSSIVQVNGKNLEITEKVIEEVYVGLRGIN